jgi:hypothetical protein
MKKNIITILTLIALSTLAHARIGETVAECDARYGEPKLIKADSRMYHKSGYTVRIAFDENKKCGEVCYMITNGEGSLSDKERKAFMSANGKAWISQQGTELLKKWQSPDKVAFFLNGVLVVRTLDYDDFLTAEDKRKEAEKLNAF